MYRAGLGELDAQIAAARAAQERDRYLSRIRAALQEDETRLDAEKVTHGKVLDRERKDVEKLEGFSVRGLFLSLLGKKEEKLEKERTELLEATLKHDLVMSELATVQAHVEEIDRQRAELDGAGAAVEELLAEKEAWLEEHGGPIGEELFGMSDEAGRLESIGREIDEAMMHGDAALGHLDQVLDELKSAGGWGTFDMLGGGLLATAMKHGKIDAAKDRLKDAQNALLLFQHELRDVQVQLETSEIEISGFSKFGDYFFDGLIFDWSVQAKIKKSKESVESTRGEVAAIMARLREQRVEVVEKSETLATRRKELIEGWGR